MTVPAGLRGHVPPRSGDKSGIHVVYDRLGELVPLMSNSPNQWLAADGMILRTEVGSTVHGTAVGGQDDIDEMGVFLEPPSTVIGSKRIAHYTYRTQPEGFCSGPGDLDLVAYTARKFCYLAAKGNATVLLPLWVPEDKVRWANDFGRELRANRRWFVSKRAGQAFRGYLHSQRQGLMGLRSGGTRNQGRADIRAKYGFDTKFAMHMVRIGLQGVHLLREGELPVPVPEQQLRWLQELRRGEHSKDEALDYAARLEKQLDDLIENSPAPDHPDQDAIDRWLEKTHRKHWGWT